jgi:EAL domain-containing protein (putative c-di-GMP-specific phosphodiesterase class I)
MATVQETIDSGIVPIVIELNDVNFFESREKLSRTFLTINSLDLGVLTYKQYRMVARRTKQANQLTDRHVQKLFRALPGLMESRDDVSCYIIPVYARLVRDGELVDILLRAMSIYPDAYPARVCIEISSDILFEDIEKVKERISQLREMGFKIAISEVGDRYCPILTLAQIDFDYAFLDESVVASLVDESGEKVAQSMIGYLKSLEVKTFAPDTADADTLAVLRRIGCDGFVENLPTDEAEEAPEEPVVEAEELVVEVDEPVVEAEEQTVEETVEETAEQEEIAITEDVTEETETELIIEPACETIESEETGGADDGE